MQNMKNNVCLVIIYNHKFERNIEALNRIYKNRFSHIYHVMPFYQGDDQNVIGVYENSYQFQGYITQAYSRIKGQYSHYVFVADDMVINPELNEANIVQKLGLDESAGFVSGYEIITDDIFVNWRFAPPSIKYFVDSANSVEWKGSLPTIGEARDAFNAHGLNWKNGVSRKLYDVLKAGYRAKRSSPYVLNMMPPFNFIAKWRKLFSSADKLYPLAFGYSDFIVVPAVSMDRFCHIAGVFAATRMFVEIAIPTAMLLSCKRVLTLQASEWSAENGVNDYKVRKQLEDQSNFSFKKLLGNWPQNYLYIHPIKLSKWKDLP